MPISTYDGALSKAVRIGTICAQLMLVSLNNVFACCINARFLEAVSARIRARTTQSPVCQSAGVGVRTKREALTRVGIAVTSGKVGIAAGVEVVVGTSEGVFEGVELKSGVNVFVA